MKKGIDANVKIMNFFVYRINTFFIIRSNTVNVILHNEIQIKPYPTLNDLTNVSYLDQIVR